MTKRILFAFFSLSLVSLVIQANPVLADDNQAPFFLNWNPGLTATSTVNYTYDVDVKDPEDQPITFSLLSGPAGMTIDSNSGVISWTPGESQASTTPYDVEVQATDGVNSISGSYQITVSSANQAPFFVGWNPPLTATATEAYSYDVNAIDPDSDPLVFSLINSVPTGMTINASSGLIEWTPTAEQATSTAYTITVQVTDGTHTITADFDLVVGEAAAENLTPFFVGWNPTLTATTTEAYSYDVDATDPESDPLVFSLVTAPAGMTINASSGLIEWTPDASQASTTPHDVTVEVSDPTHTISGSFQILVSEGGTSTSTPTSTPGGGGNLAPFFLNWNPSLTATATVAYSYDVDALDPESDPLVFSLINTVPTGMTINASSGLIEWTPDASLASTTQNVTVQVADPTHTISRTFDIMVSEAPTTPTSTPTSTPPTTPPGCTSNCGGGGGGSVTLVPASNPQCPPNCGGGTPPPVITPPPTNLPPYFVNFNPGTVVTAGTVYLYDTEAIDPESQPLTFSVLEGPTGLNIVSSTGMIYWVPENSQVSVTPYTVVLQVSDGFLSATTSYVISVVSPPIVVPEPPVVIEPPIVEPTSTPTTTVTTVPAGPSLLANIIDWFRDNYCILGYLLWLLTLLAWLIYLLLDQEDDEENREDAAQELQEEPGVEEYSESAGSGIPPVIPIDSSEREEDETKEV